jgi:tetratricopeptide (TPR) repeat protein
VSAEERVRELYRQRLDAFRRGDQAGSCALNEEALELACVEGDRAGEALALVGLSRVAFREGDNERVKELALVARDLARKTGDRSAEAAPLHMVAAGTRLTGEYDEARALYLESLELNRSLDNTRLVAVELHNLGHVELHRGDVASAERLFADRRELRNADDPYERAMDALNDAALAAAHGDSSRAEKSLRLSEETLAAAGIVLDPDDRFELDGLRDRIENGITAE